MNASVLLKGEGFANRYRLTGMLTTTSPFHLGSGYQTTRPSLVNPNTGEPVKIEAVASDHGGKPIIPGSSLKGVIRSYLLNLLCSIPSSGSSPLAMDRDFEQLLKIERSLQEQKAQIKFIKEKGSVLERLFGTPFAEGKIEFWDSTCLTNALSVHSGINRPEAPPFWDTTRLTYVSQSVAIDPVTHTAIDQKLFHFEIVPPGISFGVNIVGQNISDIEMGMLLFGLEAFNSEIWPLHLGAMSGRGFGRFRFKADKLYFLGKDNLSEWIRSAVANAHAGYQTLKALSTEERAGKIDSFKKAFLAATGGRS